MHSRSPDPSQSVDALGANLRRDHQPCSPALAVSCAASCEGCVSTKKARFTPRRAHPPRRAHLPRRAHPPSTSTTLPQTNPNAVPLPPELISRILSYLPPESVVSFALTCRRFHPYMPSPPPTTLSGQARQALLVWLEPENPRLYFCHPCNALHTWQCVPDRYHRLTQYDRYCRDRRNPWYYFAGLPGIDSYQMNLALARLVMNRHLYGDLHAPRPNDAELRLEACQEPRYLVCAILDGADHRRRTLPQSKHSALSPQRLRTHASPVSRQPEHGAEKIGTTSGFQLSATGPLGPDRVRSSDWTRSHGLPTPLSPPPARSNPAGIASPTTVSTSDGFPSTAAAAAQRAGWRASRDGISSAGAGLQTTTSGTIT